MAATITAHDNQSRIDLTRPPSTRGAAAARVFDVPLVRASAASLAGFGRPVASFASAGCDITPFPLAGWRRLVPGTGDEGGVVEDVFELARDGRAQLAVNVGLGRRYVTGWYGADPANPDDGVPEDDAALNASILTHEANYHPDGGQVFCARVGAPFILLLARPGDDVAPAHFRAFFVDPADGFAGVHISAGVWHQPAFPAAGAPPRAVLDNRQGKVHGCVGVSFLDEFGGYLRVPLAASACVDAPPPAPSPAPPRLGYAILYVESVPAALAFYAAAFGLRERLLAPGGDYGEAETGATALGFASRALGAASTRGALAAAPRGAPPAPCEVGLVVADVDAALARALAAGAELAAPVTSKPWGQRVAYVRDLDGFLVELCSAVVPA